MSSTELVWKVARSTSAAPYYFTEFEGYIDGGMLANNPSVDALTEIHDHFRKNSQKLPISLVLSVGSGLSPPEGLSKIDVHKNPLNPILWKKFSTVMKSVVRLCLAWIKKPFVYRVNLTLQCNYNVFSVFLDIQHQGSQELSESMPRARN